MVVPDISRWPDSHHESIGVGQIITHLRIDYTGHFLICLIREHKVRKPRDESACRRAKISENRLESVAGNQHRHAAYECDIFTQKGPVFESAADVSTDKVLDIAVEKILLEGTGVVEPDQLRVGDHSQLWCEVHIHSNSWDHDPWIHKIRLRLYLTGSEVRDK